MNGTDIAAVLPGQATARGAVFTRREIVEFVLDLAGYVPGRPLHRMCLMEPCIGQGDFLFPIIDRLLAAWKSDPQKTQPVADLCNALCGIELHRETFLETRRETMRRLLAHGLSANDAHALADTWLRQGDFLLVDLNSRFHFVIGNPPYVRQELIPDTLLAEYRARYHTIFDRADLYIPFIERSLTLLAEGGQLGFICSDRWMKNRYGALLRQMVSANFHLKIYVDMFDTPAFQSDVIAYPAITIIAREQDATTRVAHRSVLTSRALPEIAGLLTAPVLPTGVDSIQSVKGVTAGAEPWVLESPDHLALVRRLESEFPTLEDAGCKVGIGVATGADAIFIAPYDALDVEPDRKLPLVTTGDIVARQVDWGGLGVINPFAGDGRLVSLDQYPRLQRYLAAHKALLSNRHVARKNPANWYRTIDRIYPDLMSAPKLLIPDIKSEACITYEDGHYYPHHNLYYITSQEWDLKALQAVLQAGIARLFVFMYSTRMRGGYMRFQAQYLRRIRVPYWHQMPPQLKEALLLAVERGDAQSSRHLVWQIYGLSEAEQETFGCGVE